MSKQATAADIREILRLTGWTVRDLAEHWDCTEAAIYQWLKNGVVTAGCATWCVRKTVEEARQLEAKLV